MRVSSKRAWVLAVLPSHNFAVYFCLAVVSETERLRAFSGALIAINMNIENKVGPRFAMQKGEMVVRPIGDRPPLLAI